MTAPRIRAGDSDRQQAVNRLARHFTDGRLDSTEYDERVRRAYAGVYLDELPPLFSDLPAEPVPQAHNETQAKGRGRLDHRTLPGHPAAPALVHVLRSTPVLPVLAVVLLLILLITHGIFLPVPLIWIGLFRLNAARRSRRPGGRW